MNIAMNWHFKWILILVYTCLLDSTPVFINTQSTFADMGPSAYQDGAQAIHFHSHSDDTASIWVLVSRWYLMMKIEISLVLQSPWQVGLIHWLAL